VNHGLVHYNRSGYWTGFLQLAGTLPWDTASSKQGALGWWPEEGGTLEDRLKNLMQELGNAINDSLSDSDRIAEAIGEIKQAGYDVFLVLEATIGFNKRDGDEETETSDSKPDTKRVFETTGKLKFTSQDQRFLRALKIAVDEESH
jgi:hypothetical protein